MSQESLVNKLENKGVLESDQVKKALLKIDRGNFVTPENIDLAYEDTALPTFEGQTISQPQTVIFMLEKLELNKDLSVLEIGFGSGWVTALIAEIIGSKGTVDAFEIVPRLYEFGLGNLKPYDFKNINLHLGSVVDHFKISNKKYDRIISGAAFGGNLELIRNSLKVGGIAVIPMQNNSIHKITRTKDDFIKENYYGFVFVPLKIDS